MKNRRKLTERNGSKAICHFTNSITDTVHKLTDRRHHLEELLRVFRHQIQQVKKLNYQAGQSQHPQQHLLRKTSVKVTGIREVLVNSTCIKDNKYVHKNM